ncbi:MAG: CotH kinase family protein [Paludibacter sp.]|nr:CotH kinase family protein [Paludibacter sp.]
MKEDGNQRDMAGSNGLSYLFKTMSVCVVTLLVSMVNAQEEVPDTISAYTNGFDICEHGGEYVLETLAEQNNTLVINEILASNSKTNTDEKGDYNDWFEIYNFGEAPVHLKDYYFTDSKNTWNKWKVNDENDSILQPGAYMIFWADGEDDGRTHTNFKLSADGEYIAIYTTDGTLVNDVDFGKQSSDIAYGCYPDASLDLYYLSEPTPGRPNTNSISGGQLSKPVANIKSGVYTSAINISLSVNEKNCRIHYTTDFSTPTIESPVYINPIEVTATTVIRAKTFKSDCIESATLSLSYIITDEEYENPIISIVSDDKYLYGTQGIFKGKKDIEIPADFEYIENGQTAYSSGLGIKLHSPKNTKQYSMRFYARGRYGSTWFEYPFFSNNNPGKFKRLLIRNGGNDCVQIKPGNTHFRDQLIQRLAKKFNYKANVAESKPVNVFVNGNFFGLYNLREHVDEYYMETHFPDIKDYDLLERAFGYPGNKNPIYGNFDKWNKIMDFVDREDSVLPDNDYETISQLVDIKQFTDYWLTEIIVGNYDWLSNNVKFFVPSDGQCQWILWDTDHGLGLKYGNYGSPDWNTLKWSLTFSDRAWPDGYNNRLVRNLLKNNNYRNYFINRLTYLLDVKFIPEVINPELDSISSLYKNDITRHIAQWGISLDSWNSGLETIKSYVEQRGGFLFAYIKDFFGLDDPVQLTVHVDPEDAGQILFNHNYSAIKSFDGKIFPDFDYDIQALASAGFVFSGWEGLEDSASSVIIHPICDKTIVAKFIKDPRLGSFQPFVPAFFNVYPVPARDRLNITFDHIKAENVRIKVFNVLGAVVLNEKISVVNYNSELNISELKAGIYTLFVNCSEGCMQKKFMVYKN